MCFQRIAADILGIKLNKAELEQSQVIFPHIHVFLFPSILFSVKKKLEISKCPLKHINIGRKFNLRAICLKIVHKIGLEIKSSLYVFMCR